MSSDSPSPTSISSPAPAVGTLSPVLTRAAELLNGPSRTFILDNASRETSLGIDESRLASRLSILISDASLSAWAEMTPWEAGPGASPIPDILRDAMREWVTQNAAAPKEEDAADFISALSQAFDTKIDVGDAERLFAESKAVSQIFVLWMSQSLPV